MGGSYTRCCHTTPLHSFLLAHLQSMVWACDATRSEATTARSEAMPREEIMRPEKRRTSFHLRFPAMSSLPRSAPISCHYRGKRRSTAMQQIRLRQEAKRRSPRSSSFLGSKVRSVSPRRSVVWSRHDIALSSLKRYRMRPMCQYRKKHHCRLLCPCQRR